MSALAEIPRERRLRSDRLRVRSEVSLHVARVLAVEVEQFADLCIYEVLLKIPYVTRERASKWLAKAGCNPLRLGSELTTGQRVLLCRQLAEFAKSSAESGV